MKPMNTVIFDLDDTLHDDSAAYHESAVRVAEYIAQRYSINADQLAAAYIAAADDFWQNLSPRELSSTEYGVRARFWGLALAQFGIRDRDVAGWCSYAYDQYRSRHLTVFPGVHDMLTGLRQRGIKLGLLTNGFAQTHRSTIAQLGLDKAFDGVFLADEVGMVKPDPKIFLYACERLGSSADHAAMVGDRYDRDIIGARAAGLFTVWVDVGRDALPKNSPPPDAIIKHAIETPRVLQLQSAA